MVCCAIDDEILIEMRRGADVDDRIEASRAQGIKDETNNLSVKQCFDFLIESKKELADEIKGHY